MSVAQITAREFGIFAGIVVKLEALPLAEVCQLCEIAASGNRRAYQHQYSESIEPVSASDVEREALHALADPTQLGNDILAALPGIIFGILPDFLPRHLTHYRYLL